MDGYGKLSVYDAKNSTSENKIYVAENVDYTSNNGEYTFTWTYNGETKTVTGVIRGMSSGKTTIPCFVIYQSEMVATTYVNPDDFSLIVLDKLGGAVKYAANGTKESGSYTMIRALTCIAEPTLPAPTNTVSKRRKTCLRLMKKAIRPQCWCTTRTERRITRTRAGTFRSNVRKQRRICIRSRSAT